jgi:hypothetical protein
MTGHRLTHAQQAEPMRRVSMLKDGATLLTTVDGGKLNDDVRSFEQSRLRPIAR